MLPSTMRAARLHGYGKPLQIDEVPVPRPGAGQVLIPVKGAGFCHSDLHVISGEIQILPRMPLTLGHENAGIVAAVGAGIQTVKEGDAVAGGATACATTASAAKRTSACRGSVWASRTTTAGMPSSCWCRTNGFS